jgi:RNA polymerase sigma-70 factor (sigma-E family)
MDIAVDGAGRMALVGGMDRAEGRLAELYEVYAPRATSLAYLLTGDPELARDLAQDAFLRVAARFRHLRSPDAFGSYLRRTVVNLARNHFRRARLERDFLESGGELRARLDDLDVLERRDAMWRLLAGLPYRQRAALVLRYYEDLPEAEVADLMGCSVHAVNALVGRGLRALRKSHLGSGHG